ncbi:hypothetical protein H0H81_001835 [Sphagnurus paluster]|uniref:Uncharacterized protein n=1 Tax=Sphagnurus paluster TaxID=117069 RepID=A0A9P7K319_9AGAR|nr:hypothetical protein H0H81_001835 [Sphagnurus paluster]
MASKFPASPLTVAYDAPPDVKQPYNPEDWLEDTPAASYTLELFLSSHIKESEAFCAESDGGKKRLSFCAVRGFIECLQGLMSHSSTDLMKAIDSNRHTTRVASEHRKKTSVLGSILGTARISSPLTFIKSMDDLERHAELCYAEALFEKALLEIIHSGNSLTLNMPAIVNIYYYLNEYIKETDSAYTASQSTSSLSSSSTVDELLEDPVIDAHFRSGVYLGMGVYNIVFSLLPPRLAYLGNVFGYKADRGIGLKFLMRAGGWENEDGEPMVGVGLHLFL